MYSDKNIANIIKLLNESKFNEALLNEISNSAMLMCYFYDGKGQVVNQKYKILLDDMISSFLNMPTKYENIVYTNPFNIFNFSWIFKVIKNSTKVKEVMFNKNILDLIKSNLVLSNEFPIEMKASVIVNIYSKEYLKKYYSNWDEFVKNNTKNVLDKGLFLTKNILKSLLVYNSEYIDFNKKEFFEKIGVYLLLHHDYSTLIILASRINDIFLKELVKQTDDDVLSISDLFGKGLILQNAQNK